MTNELTPIEESQQEYIRATMRSAKDLSEQKIMDALCVVENQLRRIRLNLRPEHDGKVGDKGAIKVGIAAITSLLDVWPEIVELDYADILRTAERHDVFGTKYRLPEDDEYLIDELRQHVAEFFEQMKVTR